MLLKSCFSYRYHLSKSSFPSFSRVFLSTFSSNSKKTSIKSSNLSASTTSNTSNITRKIPITVLSGFLGAGKTTFLSEVLSSENTCKFGLVVNDVASINVDSKLIKHQTWEKSNNNKLQAIELQNGCVCCSLAEDLMSSIAKLISLADVKGDSYDHIIVECSGIAEPRKIRELFQEAEDYNSPLVYNIKLDTLITIVDAALFFETFGSKLELNDKADLAYKPDDIEGRAAFNSDGSGSRMITELLLEQVECADIILINKCDLLTNPSDISLVEKVIFNINPNAKVITCSKGKIQDPMSVIGIIGEDGAASWGILDEHRKMISAVEKNIDKVERHSNEHVYSNENECDVKDCKDPSHSHEHIHEHIECQDSSCKDPSHHHDHSHLHDVHEEIEHDHCHDNTCKDPTHNHDHSHNHNTKTTAEERFGITSFIYKRRKPFNPVRLSKFLQSVGKLSITDMNDIAITNELQQSIRSPNLSETVLLQAKKALLRSKGFVWMASSKSTVYYLSHAGQYIELLILGRWWDDIPMSEWPKDMVDDILLDFESSQNNNGNSIIGDRRQELVFIGQFDTSPKSSNSQRALEDVLDSCLLTDEEMKVYIQQRSKGDAALREAFFKS